MKRVHVLISGRVQGVFFRANIRNLANKLGLKGFVRNFNNKVEAVFEGSGENIERMLEFCRKGPFGAKVEKVKIKEEKYKKEFENFEVRY